MKFSPGSRIKGGQGDTRSTESEGGEKKISRYVLGGRAARRGGPRRETPRLNNEGFNELRQGKALAWFQLKKELRKRKENTTEEDEGASARESLTGGIGSLSESLGRGGNLFHKKEKNNRGQERGVVGGSDQVRGVHSISSDSISGTRHGITCLKG